ncbi:reverse transcriptase-rnase h-integrase [Moniliophthora roreri MCA 2997]|uniref:Reverse transcriptase-rnase h-integrase n=2 Tax=Moniliophthora roreri TaxID=221103 RepID=V2WQS9_MONRO|nr:reverse transcriptase-rnase h-integrase [Moniliophthora roreri MCA 2997]
MTSQELAQVKKALKKAIEELVLLYLAEHYDWFEKGKSEQFPLSQPYDHAINLKLDFVPQNCKLYPLSLVEQAEQDKFIEENLWKRYIYESKSPQKLNKGTIKNIYLLSLISELIDKLKGARIFSKLDLWNGYNNIRIKDGDQWKAASKTN